MTDTTEPPITGVLDMTPPSLSAAEDVDDLGRMRELKRMRARLSELETLYASRFRFQVPTALSTREQVKRCSVHPHVVVDDHAAKVTCSECGAQLDPLDVLRQFARHERSFAFTLEHLRHEKDGLTKEITELKRQKSQLRSAIRKAGGKPVESWHIRQAEFKNEKETK